MTEQSTVAIGIEQLLSLRLLPAPLAHNRPISNSRWLGVFPGTKRGHGTDYDDLRAYSPGDDVRHIDWRVSARTQQLHTRLYREEKEHRITVICDLRPCMFTGTQQLRANHAVMLAARVLWLACLSGTLVNLIVLTSSGVRLMQPGTGHDTAIRGCTLLVDEHSQVIGQLSNTMTLSDVGIAGTQHATTSDKAHTLKLHAGLKKNQRVQALAVENPAHGPTLQTIHEWMLKQQDITTAMLWISALDYPGERFFNSVSAKGSPVSSLFVYIDEPVLHTGLPGGEYQYASESDNSSAGRIARKRAQIDKYTKRKLRQQLAQLRQERQDIMSSLQIPCISTINGDDVVIAELRYQGWLP